MAVGSLPLFGAAASLRSLAKTGYEVAFVVWVVEVIVRVLWDEPINRFVGWKSAAQSLAWVVVAVLYETCGLVRWRRQCTLRTC